MAASFFCAWVSAGVTCILYTGPLHCRIRYRVRQIRELMAVWEGWMRFNQPANYQPPAWEEADLFNNVLPWTAASAAYGLTEQHLHYKAYCISQELRRCEEELRFLPQDAVNTLRYFESQQNQLAAALEAANSGERQAAAPAVAAMWRGKAHIACTWQARIAGMQQAAATAFQKAGWIVPVPSI